MASGLCFRLLRPGRSLDWASFLRPSVGLPLDRFADQQFSSQAAAGAAAAAPMEVERDASPAGLPSHLDARLLEALPEWLPLLPGRSYWRPPRLRGLAEPEVDWQRLLLPQGTWYGVPQIEVQGEGGTHTPHSSASVTMLRPPPLCLSFVVPVPVDWRTERSGSCNRSSTSQRITCGCFCSNLSPVGHTRHAPLHAGLLSVKNSIRSQV